jgi:hypothetical protein
VTVPAIRYVDGQDGDGFRWVQIAGGYVREDLFDGYQPPVKPVTLWPAPFQGYVITSRHNVGGHKGYDLALMKQPDGTYPVKIVTASAVGQVAFLYRCDKCTAAQPSSLMQGFAADDPRILNDIAWGYGYGNGVVIRHKYRHLPDEARAAMDLLGLKNGWLYVAYTHLADIRVAVDECVGPGSELGQVGNTGNSSGPHTHVECRADMDDDLQSIYGRQLVNPAFVFNL